MDFAFLFLLTQSLELFFPLASKFLAVHCTVGLDTIACHRLSWAICQQIRVQGSCVMQQSCAMNNFRSTMPIQRMLKE